MGEIVENGGSSDGTENAKISNAQISLEKHGSQLFIVQFQHDHVLLLFVGATEKSPLLLVFSRRSGNPFVGVKLFFHRNEFQHGQKDHEGYHQATKEREAGTQLKVGLTQFVNRSGKGLSVELESSGALQSQKGIGQRRYKARFGIAALTALPVLKDRTRSRLRFLHLA